MNKANYFFESGWKQRTNWNVLLMITDFWVQRYDKNTLKFQTTRRLISFSHKNLLMELMLQRDVLERSISITDRQLFVLHETAYIRFSFLWIPVGITLAHLSKDLIHSPSREKDGEGWGIERKKLFSHHKLCQ